MSEFTLHDNDTLFPVVYKKTKGNYSLRTDVKHDFDKLAEDKSFNKSGVIEKLLVKFLASQGLTKYQKELEKK